MKPRAPKPRPRTSWDGPYDPELSPLRGLAALNPPIVVTDEARRKAAEKLEIATRPYRKSPPIRRIRQR